MSSTGTRPESADEPAAIDVRRVTSARDQVANQLRKMVLRGQLVAGDRLPNQEQLAEQFGVSRGTLREGIQTLTTEGLLTIARGAKGGTLINVPKKDRIVDYLTSTLSLLTGAAEMTVEELFEAREVLEVYAARRAAERRTAEDIEGLHRLTLGASPDASPSEQYETNRQFHEMVAIVARNRFLHLVSEPLYLTLQNQVVRDRAPPEFWGGVHHDHGEIFVAIEAGSPEDAAQKMSDHLAGLRPSYQAAWSAGEARRGASHQSAAT